MAEELYNGGKDGKGKGFQLAYCWKILRDEDKWGKHHEAHVGRKSGKKRKNVSSSNEILSENDAVGDEQDEGKVVRPLGQKKVKANDQKAAFLEMMYDSIMKRQEESRKTQEKLLKEIEEKNQMELLTTDLDSIKNPVARQIIELKLKTLLARLQKEAADENNEDDN